MSSFRQLGLPHKEMCKTVAMYMNSAEVGILSRFRLGSVALGLSL